MLSKLRFTYCFNMNLSVFYTVFMPTKFHTGQYSFIVLHCIVVYCMYYRDAHDYKLNHIDSDPKLQRNCFSKKVTDVTASTDVTACPT